MFAPLSQAVILLAVAVFLVTLVRRLALPTSLAYLITGLVLGPGALASDAHTLGIDPMLLRDRQDEAIGVIRRLMRGERLSITSDWFTLQDAALQLLPLQEEMPFAVASQISPSGMTLAGKHGIGIISIGSLSEEGLNALPTQPRMCGPL